MKKNKWNALLGTVAGVALLFGTAGCDSGEGTGNKDYWTMETVFAKAQELGYGGTLEEFKETIKGNDGVGIKNVYIQDGNLYVRLDDDRVIDCGKVVGADGKDGVDGKDGADGKDGVDGKDGADGKDGVDGKDGINGTDGKDGANGADGATWLTGAGVPTAESGKNGDLYLDLSTCDIYKKADGAWSKLCNIKGEAGVNGTNGTDGKDGINGTNGTDGKDGANGVDGKDGINGTNGKDGADGATWLTGEGVPTAENGKNGDLYLDLSTCDIYKKADGVWSKLCNIKGEAGANGTDGKDGTNGVDGKDGINGTNGTDGKDGTNGTDGKDGINGTDGADGATWLAGAGVPTAEDGKNGDLYLDSLTCDVYKKADGAWNKLCNIKGANGTDGKDGTNGTNGVDGKDGAAACTHENTGEWETVIKADCDTTGVKKRVCSDCGHIEYEFEAEHGHDLVLIEGTEKTQCEGHVVVYYCNTCGEVVSKYIKGTGHNLVNGACQNEGCDYKENDGGSSGGETTVAAPTESEWNAAFGKLVAAKNYKLYMNRHIVYNNGNIYDYKGDILFTDGVLGGTYNITRTNGENVTTSEDKTIYTEKNGVLYEYTYNASTDTWSKKASSMTLSEELAVFTDVYEVFKNAYSTVTWDSENGYFYAAEYTFTDDDETITLTDVIVKIENGYVTMISYSQKNESGNILTLTMKFSDYGNVTVTVPEVKDENGSSSGSETTVTAPTESEWNAAFDKLMAAENYKNHTEKHIEFDNGTIIDVKEDVLFTSNAVRDSGEMTSKSGESTTKEIADFVYIEENGVVYQYTYNAETETWTKKVTSDTLSGLTKSLIEQYEVLKGAYSAVTWNSEKGYFFAAEYTYTSPSTESQETIYNVTVKIENGYVTMISYEAKAEEYKGTLTMTFSDYGEVTVAAPEVEDESGNEVTDEQE